MQETDVNNFGRFGRSSPSVLSLFILSVIAIVVTLPMTSCWLPEQVTPDQYSEVAFNNIQCRGTYNAIYLQTLSQICFDHTHGYHDPKYAECRNRCFSTHSFRSYAAMHHAVKTGEQKADAWLDYLNQIWDLYGSDPRNERT